MKKAQCPSGHQISLEYWFEDKDDRWIGKLVYQEVRMTAAYGGAVATTVMSRKGGTYGRFMGLVRRQAIRDINTFWT